MIAEGRGHDIKVFDTKTRAEVTDQVLISCLDRLVRSQELTISRAVLLDWLGGVKQITPMSNQLPVSLQEFTEQINKLQRACGMPDHAATFVLGCIFVRLCRNNGADPAAHFADVLRTRTGTPAQPPARMRHKPVAHKGE